MMHPEYKGPKVSVTPDKPQYESAGVSGEVRPAWGYVIVEVEKKEGQIIAPSDETRVRGGANITLIAKGGDWYPFNGQQMPFDFEVGDKLVIHAKADFTALDRKSEDDPIRLIVRMHFVLGSVVPDMETKGSA